MKILLFDRDEVLQGTLKDLEVTKHPEEINGENILEITTYDTQEIKKDYRIVYKDIYGYWHEFIIKGIEEIREDNGIEKQLFCESSLYETLGDFIEDKRPEGPASHALSVALEPTRWEVGQVDDLGTNKTNFYRCSAKEAIAKVAETWEGEIRTRVVVSGNRITKRYVDLLHRRGNDLGKRFTYTKDLESITKTVHRDDVVTALYGFGKGEEIEDEEGDPTGGFGRRIDFAEVNNGKSYVENNEARLIWGRNNSDGSKSHVFGKVEFDDCEDKEELLQLTKDKLKELSRPLITYEAKVIDLKALGFEHEGVELGDTVTVIDKEFTPELRVQARVVKITRDLLEPVNNEIILGNFITNIADSWNEQEEYINNFRGKQGVWDRSGIINPDGTIKASYLQDLIDELNQGMNSQGGYVYISEDGEGLTTYDKPIDQNPTMAIQIKGGGFRIANSKLPNGEFDWRTFGTGDGFVADYITAGILNAGLIKAGLFESADGSVFINMEDGAVSIGKNIKITENSIRVNHEDGSYSMMDKNGMLKFDAGTGRKYHHLTKIIKFSVGGDGQSPAVRWIPIGPEFNDLDWSVALSISDSMQATSLEATLHRMVLTQGHDSNNNVLQPRFRNGQWEYPVMGYTTYYNHKTDSRRYSDLAGIMIVTA